MQDILKKIENDFKNFLKSNDKLKSGVLRMLKSSIKNAEIEKRKELTSEEVMAILSKEVKKRKEAVELYKKGERQELADKEEQEIEIISTYLPEELSDEEIRQMVLKAIPEVKASSLADFGKVMGKVMSSLKGQADGNKVSGIVKEELNKL